MRGKMFRFVLVFAVTMVLIGGIAERASAFYPVGWFLGIARGPAVCGSPCDGGWYIGLRPGPVRRMILGPYRYYPGYCNYGWCAPVACCNVCYNDICCCGMIATTTVTATTAVETHRPTLAPKDIESENSESQDTTPVTPDSTPSDGSDFTPAGPYGNGVESSGLFPMNQSATITLNVPADAKVFVNDYQTKSTGPVRQFASRNLMPGFDYEYKIRVEIVRNGQILEANRIVVLRSGQTFNVALRHNELPVAGLAQAQ